MSSHRSFLLHVYWIGICAIILSGFVVEAKTVEYKFTKPFISKLKNPEDSSHNVGGYAKYSLSLLVAKQETLDFLESKKDSLRFMIEQSVAKFNATNLQSSNDRKVLANTITKDLNAALGENLIKATYVRDFVIMPDIMLE